MSEIGLVNGFLCRRYFIAFLIDHGLNGFTLKHLLHGGVQILTGNVRLRGLAFMLNFVAVLGLWVLVMVASRGAH